MKATTHWRNLPDRGDDESSFSLALDLQGPLWGDITSGFDADAETWLPPDDGIDIFPDVVSAIEAFSNSPGNPTKLRADVEPCVLDFLVNISDITQVLDAFRSLPFPFGPGVGDCPSGPCGASTSASR